MCLDRTTHNHAAHARACRTGPPQPAPARAAGPTYRSVSANSSGSWLTRDRLRRSQATSMSRMSTPFRRICNGQRAGTAGSQQTRWRAGAAQTEHRFAHLAPSGVVESQEKLHLTAHHRHRNEHDTQHTNACAKTQLRSHEEGVSACLHPRLLHGTHDGGLPTARGANEGH